VISGSTGSGKSILAYRLLHYWPFDKKIGNFIYFYNVWQDLFEIFLKEFPQIRFINGLSQNDIENRETWKCKNDEVNICIVDDLADDALKSGTFARLFTVYGHHWNIINIFISQNLYCKVRLCKLV